MCVRMEQCGSGRPAFTASLTTQSTCTFCGTDRQREEGSILEDTRAGLELLAYPVLPEVSLIQQVVSHCIGLGHAAQ